MHTVFLRVLTFLTLVATINAMSADRSGNRTFKLLTIGNSFSKNATRYLKQISESCGYKLKYYRADLSACSLEKHWENAKNDKKVYYAKKYTLKQLLSKKWDAVTIQQVSYNSFKSETYQPYADKLIKYIRKYSPTSEILVHQTWAYRTDHYFFKRKGSKLNQQKMFEGLRDCYNNLAKTYNLRILPSGSAMQACREKQKVKFTFPDSDFSYKNPVNPQLPKQDGSLIRGWYWYNRKGKKRLRLDSIHANVRGEYLQGCVWFEVLFRESAENIKFVPKEISEKDAAFLREIAHETVSTLEQTNK